MADQTAVVDFRLPSLGSDMEEGTIIEWNVAVGDNVAKGDTLLAVETEKGDIDVETWDSGVITELCVAVGATVPVGAVIARIATGDSESPVAPRPVPVATITTTTPIAAPSPSPSPTSTPPAPQPAEPDHPIVSPRLVFWPAGTAPSAATAGPSRSLPAADDEWSGIDDPMRRAVARTMSRSNREIPHYHLQQVIDLDAAERWLLDHNERVAVAQRVVMAALLTKATALAARSVPELNGHWTEHGLSPADDVDIGLIIRRRDGGIVAPVIHGADVLGVPEVMTRLTDVATRAKSGDLTTNDLANATITITNLGDRGVDSVLGVIPPPQVGLVGFGRPTIRPVIVDSEVVARLAVVATLSGDHRATDGHAGARFLRAIDRVLQEPEKL